MGIIAAAASMAIEIVKAAPNTRGIAIIRTTIE
jgi:hypothetical protein